MSWQTCVRPGLEPLSRKHWEPKNWDRVGRHFVTGEPSDDSDDVDYRPILLMKGQEDQCLRSPSTLRQERTTKRLRDSHMRELSEVIYVNHNDHFHALNLFSVNIHVHQKPSPVPLFSVKGYG